MGPRAYGQLDIDISRHQAPWVTWRVPNYRFFTGRRINPKSVIYHPVYQSFTYNVLALRPGT